MSAQASSPRVACVLRRFDRKYSPKTGSVTPTTQDHTQGFFRAITRPATPIAVHVVNKTQPGSKHDFIARHTDGDGNGSEGSVSEIEVFRQLTH